MLERFRVRIGWGQLLREIAVSLYRDNLLGWAAELAYFSFLALFPALLFFVALASFFRVRDLTSYIVSAMAPFTPPDLLQILRDQLTQIAQHNDTGLLTLGIIGTIWSASSGMSSAIDTLNAAYKVQEGRSWW